MRHRPWPRVSAYQATTRKRAALTRSQQHQRDHDLEFLSSQAKLYRAELGANLLSQLDQALQATTRIATTHDTARSPTPTRSGSIAAGDRASPAAQASPAT